jgi:hypothetical protein
VTSEVSGLAKKKKKKKKKNNIALDEEGLDSVLEAEPVIDQPQKELDVLGDETSALAKSFKAEILTDSPTPDVLIQAEADSLEVNSNLDS